MYDCKEASPVRYPDQPDFNNQTALKEIKTFIKNFDPEKATRHELHRYERFLDIEKRTVQTNLATISLAEEVYDIRTRRDREIKAIKEDRKHMDRRLKDLGVEDKPKKTNKPAPAKPAPKKKAPVKEVTNAKK